MLPHLAIAPEISGLRDAVRAALDAKTKPPGSLGRLEELALALALAQACDGPAADPARVIVFASDHGLAKEGVSAWPQDVTAAMVVNFLQGGAAANALARACGAGLQVVDAGVAGALPEDTGLIRASLGRGTGNVLHGDAMDESQLEQALSRGAELAARAADDGVRVLIPGDMGIANSSAASLIAHALLGTPLSLLVGPGAGLDKQGIQNKLAVLERVIARRSRPDSGFEALKAYGGFEMAMMAGAMVGAAARNMAVLVDGLIASAAALAVLTDRPETRRCLIFAHRSAEPGHAHILHHLDLRPLLDLDMRLGEGTGALLALPLARAACAVLNDMATLEELGIVP